MKRSMWEPLISDRTKVNECSYKLILEEVKQKFEEQASQSEFITSRGIKIFALSLVVVSSFLSYSFVKNFSWQFISLLAVLFSINACFCYLLISPRAAYTRGLNGESAFPEGLDGFEDSSQVKYTYYNIIVTTQLKTDQFRLSNRDRVMYYRLALLFTALILLVISIKIGVSIS